MMMIMRVVFVVIVDNGDVDDNYDDRVVFCCY